MKLTTERLLTGVLVTATLALFATPAAAGETPQTTKLEPAATTSQSLTGVTTRNASEWPWAVGGEDNSSTEADSTYQIKANPLFNQAEIEQLNRIWSTTDDNLGDYQRSSRRVPLVDF